MKKALRKLIIILLLALNIPVNIASAQLLTDGVSKPSGAENLMFFYIMPLVLIGLSVFGIGLFIALIVYIIRRIKGKKEEDKING